MNFLRTNKCEHFLEHHQFYYPDDKIPERLLPDLPPPILFKGNNDSVCFAVNESTRCVQTNYYIGVDWVWKNELAVYVQPKLNDNGSQINYLKMFLDALKYPETRNHTNRLFEVKSDQPFIEIQEHQDIITPLLVLEFLHVVKDIVQKGLKKGYYREHNNLYARVKGKVLVSETIKKNLLKNRTLSTSCSYDAFGFNIPENRLIKMALLFVGKYMTRLKLSALNEHFKENLSYISPAFEAVHDDVSISEIKQLIFNPFYKEYKRGIELAKLILKRFGYNISNTQKSELVKVPPFWIDMSKLFELYVYSFLKAEYGPFLFFQFPGKGTHIDYLVNKEGNEAIIDAKYKPSYKRGYDIIDIRQLSAYSRDEIVLKKLGISAGDMQRTVSKCLIIYPDSASNLCLWKNNEEAISGFVNFFKRSVGLPVIA